LSTSGIAVVLSAQLPLVVAIAGNKQQTQPTNQGLPTLLRLNLFYSGTRQTFSTGPHRKRYQTKLNRSISASIMNPSKNASMRKPPTSKDTDEVKCYISCLIMDS
jgi:hypothetical protein